VTVAIRALIVDDERRARAYLAKLVAAHDDVVIVGEARDGVTALREIEQLKPDLVFLDVQMPEMTGLDVARALEPGRAPIVVFTTAYDRYALDAFELSATDYLLKPYDGDRLAKSLDRVRALLRATATEGGVSERLERLLTALESGGAAQAEQPACPPLNRIPAQTRTGIVLLDTAEVYQIASEDRLVFVYTREGRFSVNFSIKELEARLPGASFFRSHRSCIVNLDHVREVLPWFHGKLMLKLDDGTETIVSEDRAPRLRALLGLG
jgi:DNA-binding LytR/AlgR family response regulator